MPTNKEKLEAFNNIADLGSPFITLGYVIDDAGEMLAHFHIHPQIGDDCSLSLEDVVSIGNKEIRITPEDLESFADTLYTFAKTARTIINTYDENREKIERKQI